MATENREHSVKLAETYLRINKGWNETIPIWHRQDRVAELLADFALRLSETPPRSSELDKEKS